MWSFFGRALETERTRVNEHGLFGGLSSTVGISEPGREEGLRDSGFREQRRVLVNTVIETRVHRKFCLEMEKEKVR
jgi:hypothetical protein